MTDVISVVMPAYNHAPFVAQAIRSVLDQEGVQVELIMVDDCSTDDTFSIGQTFLGDPRFTLLQTHRNSGPASAMNLGLSHMKGNYLALLDSDDYFLPEKLKKQMAVLKEHPEIGAVFTMPRFINEKGEDTTDERLSETLQTQNRPHWEWAAYMFRVGGFALSASILMRKSSLEKTGWMNPIIFRQTDIEFHVRLVMSEEIFILNEPLYAYRRLSGVDTNSALNGPAMIQRSLDFFERQNGFLRADSVDKVLAMFPFLKDEMPSLLSQKEEWDSTLAHFLIGLMAILTDYAMTMAFGFQVLANLLKDRNAAEKLARTMHFTPDSLRKLAREKDIFSLFEASF